MTDAGRLDALETRIAHQERTIDELNATAFAQWERIEALLRRLVRLEDRLGAAEAHAADGSPPEPPPPHY